MELGFKDKTTIVTGGASNIGRAIVLTLAKEGSNVVIADISEKQGPKVAEEAKALGGGGRIVFIKTDVTDSNSVQATVSKVLGEFGKIDILVNNVGWTYDRPFIQKPREELEKEVALNYWGAINCNMAVLPSMIERKFGRVISLSSDGSKTGQPGEAVYAGCKAAVVALSKSLAAENARYGITFNVVSPSATIPESLEYVSEASMFAPGGMGYERQQDPEMVQKVMRLYPLARAYNRLGRAEDIANAVVFLASDAAVWITGQVLSVNGGQTMA
jgi:NAD(P)-dependent dehydrogenase (short-subunit alcohol dehydrogenase family)